jgi:hypothetical protein
MLLASELTPADNPARAFVVSRFPLQDQPHRSRMARITQIIVWAVILVLAILAYWMYSQLVPMDWQSSRPGLGLRCAGAPLFTPA